MYYPTYGKALVDNFILLQEDFMTLIKMVISRYGASASKFLLVKLVMYSRRGGHEHHQADVHIPQHASKGDNEYQALFQEIEV